MKIAVIGSNNVDLITYINRMPEPGETLEAPEFAIGCGGKGANQAVAAAKCGAEVLMFSKVGDDLFADNTIANFQKAGVSTKYVEKVPNVASGVAPIFVDKNGQNRILIIKGANNYLKPSDIDKGAEDLKQCSLIILQLEVALETVYYAIEFGHKHGIPVLLNPAPAIADLDIDKVCKCDFFVPNESELSILTNLTVHTVAEIKAAAQILLDKDLKNVIVTMGSKGVFWISQKESLHIPAIKVDAIDTSGAGDAFIGAFASQYAINKDIKAALEFATKYAAISVTRKGTQTSYPEINEIEG